LGINPAQVQSPTYTYLNIYDNKLLHLDMYRLESFQQLIEKGILDQMNEYEYLLIEWPKRIDQLEI
jgi:tRNA A37 threonylcarbamoyladenosine biosynthesis protein TsaE